MTTKMAVRDHLVVLAELECSSIEDFSEVGTEAAVLRSRAVAAGDDEAVHRCDLLIADALLREGELGAGRRSADQTLAWAERHERPYVLARAHRLLSSFYRLVGDTPEALGHAVQGVANLPPDAPPGIRARHLMMLGCALDDSGSTDEGELRYREVLRIAGETGEDSLTLRALNNMAYNAYEAGDEPAGRALADQMRECATRGRPLAAKELDTVARVEMMGDRYGDVEATLAGVLDGTVLDTDGDGVAECLLTLAEARRIGGRLDAAQVALDRAVAVCERTGLSRVRVYVQREQAALYATTGQYKDAYEELLLFQSGLSVLQSTQRETRARAMQAVFEADEARQVTEHFREMAYRDALTGLYNRRYVDEQIPVLLATAAAHGDQVSVAILDLDHFKQINDTLSHATGDAVLQQLGRLLRDGTIAPAVAARLGGEEFLLILPGFDVKAAERHCERLRLQIGTFPWVTVTGGLPVTASIGVTTDPRSHATVSALLAAADRNLYAAKHAGRDRVVANVF